MKKTNFILALLVGGFLFTTSCSKDDSTPTPTPTPTPVQAPVSPTYPASDGLFQLVNTVTVITNPFLPEPIEQEVFTAVGFISNGSGGYNDIGNVTVEGKALTKQANSSYVYQNLMSFIEPVGSIDWQVSGGVGFAAASFNTTKAVPSLASFKKQTTFNLAVDNTLNVQSYNADLILVSIADAKGKVFTKSYPGSTTSVLITKDDLKELSATTYGFIQITPYNYVIKSINSKSVVIGNQTTYSSTMVEFKK